MASIRNHVTRDVVSIDGGSPCREAAKLMADRKIGSVAVREGQRIVGLTTERDLVLTVLAKGGDGLLPIRQAMRPLPVVAPDASEAACAGLMRDHFTRHLLVEEKGQVVGVVSMRDIIQVMLDEKQFVIDQLQDYIGRG
jgi:CBS domain-containing protein